MKLSFILLFLLIGFQSISQNDEYKNQLQKIIADAPNDFKNLRGRIKEIIKPGDTIFVSRIEIEGSLMNEISKSYPDSNRPSYVFFSRLDSSSIKEGKKIIERFKQKTKKALGNSYTVKPFYQNYGKSLGDVNGFIFKDLKIEIILYYGKIGQYNFAYSYLTIRKLP